MKRILITGSRHLTDHRLVFDAIDKAKEGEEQFTVVHGANPNGADRFAHEYCQEHPEEAVEEAHPAKWKAYGKAAGGIRNQHMVDQAADVCLAFPTKDSTGTWDCVRRAKEAGIPTQVFQNKAQSLKNVVSDAKQKALDLELDDGQRTYRTQER